MFSKIRKRMTYTNFALTLALVFAITGGAYAAKKYVITSTKQISPAVLKQLQGKAGSAGAPGAPGQQGPAGPAGAAGKGETGGQGPQGPAGPAGPAGKGEKGATGLGGATGVTGEKGKAGSPGEPGPTGVTGPAITGPEGVCATANCMLPSGASEKGQWAGGGPSYPTAFGNLVLVPISFTVPLDASPAIHVIQVGEEPLPPGCIGSVTNPEAEPGNLCVFIKEARNVTSVVATPGAAGTIGSVILLIPSGTENVSAFGSWAVTAA